MAPRSNCQQQHVALSSCSWWSCCCLGLLQLCWAACSNHVVMFRVRSVQISLSACVLYCSCPGKGLLWSCKHRHVSLLAVNAATWGGKSLTSIVSSDNLQGAVCEHLLLCDQLICVDTSMMRSKQPMSCDKCLGSTVTATKNMHPKGASTAG